MYLINDNQSFKLLDIDSQNKIIKFINNILRKKQDSIVFYGTGKNGKTTLINLIKQFFDLCCYEYKTIYNPNDMEKNLLITHDDYLHKLTKNEFYELLTNKSIIIETNDIKYFNHIEEDNDGILNKLIVFENVF